MESHEKDPPPSSKDTSLDTGEELWGDLLVQGSWESQNNFIIDVFTTDIDFETNKKREASSILRSHEIDNKKKYSEAHRFEQQNFSSLLSLSTEWWIRRPTHTLYGFHGFLKWNEISPTKTRWVGSPLASVFRCYMSQNTFCADQEHHFDVENHLTTLSRMETSLTLFSLNPTLHLHVLYTTQWFIHIFIFIYLYLYFKLYSVHKNTLLPLLQVVWPLFKFYLFILKLIGLIKLNSNNALYLILQYKFKFQMTISQYVYTILLKMFFKYIVIFVTISPSIYFIFSLVNMN